MHFIQNNRFFKSTEEVVSMFLGLVIVVVVIGLVFTFFQKRKGDITLPGVSSYLDITKNNQNTVDNTNKQEQSVSNQSEVYTVAYGDNLWRIAEKKYNNGFLWNEIAKANNLKNPRLLAVGQKLTIPTIQNQTNSPKKESITQNVGPKIEAGSEYTVVKNDSLWKIAVRAYGDGNQWTKIWESNKVDIKNPSKITAGIKIMVPNLNN